MHTTTKIVSLSLLALAFSAGSAFAGEGKDCNHAKKTAVKAQTTTSQQTSVLSASEQRGAMEQKAKKAKKTYSFDDALKICQEKGVADLQACIDYKTGKTEYKPKS